MSGRLFVKLDPGFLTHRKAVKVGPFGRLLYISALGYCVEGLTDGFIPSLLTSRLADIDDPDPAASAEALVNEKLWIKTKDGFQVKDYGEWQSSSQDVHKRREQWRLSQKRRRDERKTHPDESTKTPGGHKDDRPQRCQQPEPEPEPESISPLPPQGGRALFSFEEFSEAYPSRVGVEQCRKLFESFSDNQRRDAIRAATNYAIHCEERDRIPRDAGNFFAVTNGVPFWRQFIEVEDADSNADEWAKIRERKKRGAKTCP